MDTKPELRACCGAVFLASPRGKTGAPDGETTELGWSALDKLPAPLFGPDVPVLTDGPDGTIAPSSTSGIALERIQYQPH